MVVILLYNSSVSELKKQIGSYFKLYKKFSVEPEKVYTIMSTLQETFNEFEIDTTDGLKFFVDKKVGLISVLQVENR